MPETTLIDFFIQSTSDGVLVASSNGIMERINPAAASMMSVTVEEVIGKSFSQVFSKNPALINLFERSGDQSLDVRLPKRRLAVESLPAFKTDRESYSCKMSLKSRRWSRGASHWSRPCRMISATPFPPLVALQNWSRNLATLTSSSKNF
ncbi:MAG: PAS domain-containing protein [Anaerolineae bacterium]